VTGLWRRGDRTHPGHVRSVSGGERAAERGRPDAGRVRSITDRARPVIETSLWRLTGVDRTLPDSASGHSLVRQVFGLASWVQARPDSMVVRPVVDWCVRSHI
jgi:hypothetical protein